MRLQKNSLLALYGVLEFAARPGELVPASEVAEKYGESAHHLAKVLSELARAGIVEPVRGVGGGYRFTANARRLTLLDVIRLFGPSIRRRLRRASVRQPSIARSDKCWPRSTRPPSRPSARSPWPRC